MSKQLRRHIEKKVGFRVECSALLACTGDGEHELDAQTLAAAEREMIADGWLDNFIIEDTENLACPACVEYCKENASSFEELDVRAGGKAK